MSFYPPAVRSVAEWEGLLTARRTGLDHLPSLHGEIVHRIYGQREVRRHGGASGRRR